MKIALFELEDWERPPFEALETANHELEMLEESLSAGNASRFSEVEVISTFIYSELGEEVLEQLEKLEMIATRSTGFDHIAVEHCRERGITVCNVPDYGSHTVAEHVFALLLAISHHLVDAVDRTRRGDFSLQGLRGFDLRGRTLGVVGTGQIGRRVVEIAGGFGMEVLAHDVEPDLDAASDLGFHYVGLDELLAASDVVTLHVPLNEHTRHLIGEDELDRMKDDAVLINTARGGVVDTSALLRALGEGKLAAAGLDVLPAEPTIREEAELIRSMFREKHDLETLLADHVLLRLRNVIITPHSAFNTREAIQRILDVTHDNIRAFLGGKPQNVVSGEEG